MRWQGRRESDNVEDRRNSSGGPSMGGPGFRLLKRRTKNAKMFHDKCENFNFRASNETAALAAAFLFIK